MPSRKEIWDELDRIWDKSRPAKADPPTEPQVKHNRTAKIIFKTATLSVTTTLFIVTVSIYSAFSFFNPLSKDAINPQDRYRTYDPMLKDTGLLASYRPAEQSAPHGRILSPQSGSSSSRVIKITGITANIPENHYVVLAVDVEKQRVCFPKYPFIEPNAAFRTEIYDGGPEGECAVSLYAVDEEYYRKIKLWLDQKRFGGMPLIPLRYRLDGVKIRIGDS